MIYSELARGTAIRVFLPKASGVTEIRAERQLARPTRRSGKILLVEDDEDVRRLARAILEECAYTVVDTGSSHEALRLVESGQRPFDLLISDVVMPGMDGVQLQEQIRRRVPETRVLFMSGYTETTVSREISPHPNTFFISKPFTPSGLAQKVYEVLGSATSV